MIKTLFFIIYITGNMLMTISEQNNAAPKEGSSLCKIIRMNSMNSRGKQKKQEKQRAGRNRTPYSMWIASDGQTSTQVWQSTHMSLSTLALSFSMAIADAGHSLTQVSHPVHLSLSTIATNSFTPGYMFLFRVKKGLLSGHREGRTTGTG
jgi:hypothetical protein